MKSFKVAMLQLLPTGTVSGNLEKGLQACRNAKALGADAALFPEMWSTGYTVPVNSELMNQTALSLDSEFVCAFAALARELEMAIGITLLKSTILPQEIRLFCLIVLASKNWYMPRFTHAISRPKNER